MLRVADQRLQGIANAWSLVRPKDTLVRPELAEGPPGLAAVDRVVARFHEGFGTLYTAEYRPAQGAVRYHWPGRTWAQSLDTFDPDGIQIRLGTP